MRKRRVDIRHVFRAETYIGGLPIPSWKKVTCYAVERCASKYVDRYVVNGAYLRREVVNRARVKANKIVVLHNGVEGLGPADDACGIPEMPMSSHLAMIANFLPGKGHDVLIRGIVDGVWPVGKALEIVDYKTDVVSPGEVAAHAARYRPQMWLYARAVGKMWHMEVRRATLVYLTPRQMVTIDEPGRGDPPGLLPLSTSV